MKFTCEPFEYVCAFTDAYKAGGGVAAREARCLGVMADCLFLPPVEGDLLCGRVRIAEVGFSPEPLLGRSVGYYFDPQRLAALRETLGASEQARLDEMAAFWALNETRRAIRSRYPADMAAALPEDIYWEHAEPAFPLYRVVDAYLDYYKLVKLGLGGLRAEVKAEDGEMFAAMVSAVDALTRLCLRYADYCGENGLEEMAAVMRHIAVKPPVTFRQAAQLCYLYAVSAGALNYGRLDCVLGGFIKDGEEAAALEVIKSLWVLINSRESIFHGRVIIGGKGRPDEQSADRFALLAIEASKTVAMREPQLSLRFYKGQNPALMDAALDCLGLGRTYPILYNDDVNVPAVMKAFGVDETRARQYMMYGCGEYVIDDFAFGSPNGVINLLKILCDLGVEGFETFEDLYKEFLSKVEFYASILARQEWLEYEVCNETAPFLYFSLLFGECVRRGKPVFGGGANLLGGTLETYGNVNAANSLYAIKTLVYDEKSVKAGELAEALKNDFEGHDELRNRLRDCAKFGNDDDGADALYTRLHSDVCAIISKQADVTPLDYYLAVIINNEANTILGRFTEASADGRGRGEPMANGNAPSGGTERGGLTAMLLSMAKPDVNVHAGATQNVMFSSELFNTRRDKVRAALEVYWEKGGAQAMITVVNKSDLERAMKHPERYGQLMVRVGGFSARFVTLAPDVQREVASRCVY